MTAPRQLPLDLAFRPALAAEDFLVGPANEAALGIVDRWPEWPHWAVVVHGPARSGKTHLANVWRYRSKAAVIAADAIDAASRDALAGAGALVVENLETGVGDEQMLFHLLNLAREHRHSILFTSRRAPGELDIAMPDLRSRLRALPLVSIAPPDDTLLKAVLVKLFTDRQLEVEPHLVNHIALHMDRSFAAAHAIVEAIDRRALAARRRVTRALAAEVMAELDAAMSRAGQDVDRS
jgi:chromosomal replication initiation ATPase DnaA